MAKGQEIPVPMRGAIVTLRHVMKLPYGEIGLKTGINEASVKTLYHRIRARSGGPGSSLADLLNNLEDLPRSGRPRVPKAVAPASKPSPVRAYQGRVPFDRTTVVNHTRPSDRSASSCTITNTVPFENAPQLAIEYIPQYPPTTADPILGYTPQYSPAMAAPTPELTASQRETRAYYEAIYNEHRHSIPGYPAQEAHQTAAQETVPEMSQAVASMPMSSSMAQPSNGMLNSRASAGSPTAEQLEDTDDSDLEEELVGLPMESCDVVRRKIRAFLDNGEMKVGEFQNAISTNSKAYSNFMTQNGPYKGSGSSVYQKAWRFFKLRELRGIKPPKHPSKPKKGEEGAAAAAAPNLTAIELPGEMDDKVAIYDTCDEVRRKINAHMKKPGVVQAQFLRDIAASYRKAPRKVQSTQLSKFRSKKGAWEGNTSVVFYGAYVFFEKLRIAEKKPKSKKRLEMEGIYNKEGGVDTTSRHQYFSVLEGQRPYVDPYGRVNIL